MNHGTYYTISSLIDTAQFFFTRTGANDPNFNLRREPAFIIRKKGTNKAFVNVLEIHGNYNPVIEISSNANPSVKSIQLLQNDDAYSVASIDMDGKQLLVLQANKDFGASVSHTVSIQGKQVTWTGPSSVIYNGNKL